MIKPRRTRHYFARNLRAIRKSRGWDQPAMAKFLGLTPSAVCNYEKGRREPNITGLFAIADKLDVDVDFLVRNKLPLTPQEKKEIIRKI